MNGLTTAYDDILSVSQLNRIARTLLEEYSFYVTGEISNISNDSYSFKYFSLKDENSKVDCILEIAKYRSLNFTLENGQKIKIFGTMSLFEKEGRYQIKIQTVELQGNGILIAQIEALKIKLQKDGLFDDARKRKIAKYPLKVGVITSVGSAGWIDFCKVTRERFPLVKLIVYNSLVQGTDAPKNIIMAIRYFNDNYLNELSAIVITRGGGSFEDLMAFNDESLAREISKSKIPTVTAIGHEKDTCIADYVSDLRASTPSNAAEIMFPDVFSLNESMDYTFQKIKREIASSIKYFDLKLVSLRNSFQLFDPERFIKMNLYRLEELMKNIYKHFDSQINNYYHKIEYLSLKIQTSDPVEILKKGYSITTTNSNKLISQINIPKVGDSIVSVTDKIKILSVVKEINLTSQ